MIEIIEIKMSGPDHLEHITHLKWVETDKPGASAATDPKIATRAKMYEFVAKNPKIAFAMNRTRTTYAYLEAVNSHVQYVKTLPDATTSDNLLSLPRF